MPDDSTPPRRIVSLDQFRGYTVAGMFLVNFVGSFAVCPGILKHHHDYCSYADTIMPHFLFAVGFAFRLTFERRVQRDGAKAAYGRVIRRLLGLVLLSVVIYTPNAVAESWEQLREMTLWEVLARPLKREWFQTLMHIAVTSLWILPVIRSSARIRIGFAIVSAAAHVLLSYWFNFTWVNSSPNGIDGGPLAFLTWTIPAVAGTLACDAIAAAGGPRLWRLAGMSLGLMSLGWLVSCGTRLYDVPADQVESLREEKLARLPVLPERSAFGNLDMAEVDRMIAEPPFVPPPDAEHRKWNYWMMSQRGGTLSYLTFSAGFSLLVYLAFYVACDMWGWKLGLFQTWGTNALAGYVLHLLVMRAVKPFVPRDAPEWYMWAAFGVFFWISYVLVRSLERQGIYLRL